MPKRVSIRDAAERGRGADAFFTATQQDVNTVEPQNIKTVTPPTQKWTVYVPQPAILQVEELRLKRLKNGRRMTRGDILAEAISLLPED